MRALGSIALFGTATAVVGLIRGWASAPIITLLSATVGIAIGVLDATHDATRGYTIALAFALAVTGAGFLCTRQLRLRHWEKNEIRASDDLGPVDDQLTEGASTPNEPRVTTRSASLSTPNAH